VSAAPLKDWQYANLTINENKSYSIDWNIHGRKRSHRKLQVKNDKGQQSRTGEDESLYGMVRGPEAEMTSIHLSNIAFIELKNSTSHPYSHILEIREVKISLSALDYADPDFQANKDSSLLTFTDLKDGFDCYITFSTSDGQFQTTSTLTVTAEMILALSNEADVDISDSYFFPKPAKESQDDKMLSQTKSFLSFPARKISSAEPLSKSTTSSTASQPRVMRMQPVRLTQQSLTLLLSEKMVLETTKTQVIRMLADDELN
jgi:hypothetical protein